MYRAEDFRRLAVLVEHLPADSATARARGGSGLTDSERVLLDVFYVLAGERHPVDPVVRVQKPVESTAQKLLAQRERARQMREAQHGR